MSRRVSIFFAAVLFSACVPPAPDHEIGSLEHEVRVCADGPTVEGIDVSKWQADIDWDAVASDGVAFAFIRTNHGLDDLDEKHHYNWAEARRVGILRGTYQYFYPDEDAVAQADLLLERMGPLEDGDLPPVLDVEEARGQPPEVIVAQIHTWMARIEEALGVRPLIYTARYFWQDQVGAPADFLEHPLWVANYEVECPLIADPWPRWDFWQYTSSGSIAGIGGRVDRNVWNGTLDELLAFIEGDELRVESPGEVPGTLGRGGHGDDDDDDDVDPEAMVTACSASGGSGAASHLVLVAIVAVATRRRSAGTSRARTRR